MEKRLILAIIISTIILFVYNWVMTTYYYSTQPKSLQETYDTSVILTDTIKVETKITTPIIPLSFNLPDSEVLVHKSNDLMDIEFSNKGGKIKQIILKKYKTKKGENVRLIGSPGEIDNRSAIMLLTEDPSYFGQMSDAYYYREEGDSVIFEYTTKRIKGGSTLPENLLIRKIYLIDKDRYLINTDVEIINLNDKEVTIKQSLLKTDEGVINGSLFLYLGRGMGQNEVSYIEKSLYNENFVYRIDGKFKRTDPEKKKGKKIIEVYRGTIETLGLENRYFLISMFPVPVASGLMIIIDENNEKEGYLMLPEFQLKQGESFRYSGFIYAGDKRTEELLKVDKSLKPLDGLEPWILPVSIARGMVILLRWLYNIIPNYGVAIILLTILVRIVLYPLTHHSIKSMKKMQELQPKVQELKQRHADRKDEFNKAIMRLYKESGVNPMGGCLPLILQIPIFVGLFVALRNAVELRGANFCLWITDLSLPDTVYLLPFEIPLLSNFMGRNINILPILYAITMHLSSKIGMPPAVTEEQKQQQAMMKFMPLILTVLLWNFPSGLYLYFTISNILQIIQQMITSGQFRKS
ncbi:MAG: membrane protein insertase YidC [Candidatus Hydrogenedentota bacterium]